MENNRMISNGVFKMTLKDLYKVISAQWLQWLNHKKEEEARIQADRRLLHTRLNQIMKHIQEMENTVGVDELSDSDYHLLDSRLISEIQHYQMLIETLVRVCRRVARTRWERQTREMALYQEFLVRRHFRITPSIRIRPRRVPIEVPRFATDQPAWGHPEVHQLEQNQLEENQLEDNEAMEN